MLRDLKPAPPELSPGLPLQSTTSALAAAHALYRLAALITPVSSKFSALVGPGLAVMGVSAWGERQPPPAHSTVRENASPQDPPRVPQWKLAPRQMTQQSHSVNLKNF